LAGRIGPGWPVIAVGLLAISGDLTLRKLRAGPWKCLQPLNYPLFMLVIAHAVLYGALLRGYLSIGSSYAWGSSQCWQDRPWGSGCGGEGTLTKQPRDHTGHRVGRQSGVPGDRFQSHAELPPHARHRPVDIRRVQAVKRWP
jgi:hypothetical protein